MKLFTSLTKDTEEFSKKIADLKKCIDIKENMIIQTKTRLLELFQSLDNFNEILDKTKHQVSNIKSQNKTDKTLQEIIDLRKKFMSKLDEFERMKISCESFINNSLFQNKEQLIKIYNNTIAAEKDLYLKINEELVFQVESKISLLLIELGKLQIFVMDLPKNLDTNVVDIENRITEINSYLYNLQMMETDLQEIDKVLSEDLSDRLEINFELLEKAIMNIQYCEKERLLTYTDLDKIHNIVSNSYLPTMITYENNKHLAENMIIETNQSLDEYIKDFDNHAVYAKDKEAPYVVDLIKDRKLNLEKLDNVLFEIEPLVEAVESYGFDLIEQVIELTSDYGSDCSFLQSIKNDIQEIRQNFHTLKNKMAGLDSKMIELLSPNSKSQISEKLANEYESWRSFNDVLIKLDPIQSLPEKLNKQLEEISFLYDQIKKKEIALLPLKELINKLNSDNNNPSITQGDIKEKFDDLQMDYDTVYSNEIEDMNDRLKEIENLLESVYYKADYRMSILSELKDVINNYWPEMNEINSKIKQIQKNAMAIEAFPNNKDDKQYKAHEPAIIHSDSISVLTEADNKSASSEDLEDDDKFIEDFYIDTPHLNIAKPLETEIIDQELVKQQYSKLKSLENDVKHHVEKLQTELAPKASQIVKVGGKSCELEINEFNESLLEEIDITDDILEEKDILFNKALYFVEFLSDEIKKICDWITSMESRLENIGGKTPDQKLIEIDLLELKSLNSEIFSNSQRLDKITIAITEILSYPYVPNKTLLENIKLNIKDKYSELVKKIFEKHTELQKKYDDIGELDFALDDNIGILQEFENQIKNLTPQSCKGDPEFTYSCLKNLRLLSNAFNELLFDFEVLNEKISAYGDLENSENQRCRGTLSIFGKMKEISHLTDQIKLLVPEKDSMIQEILKNEKLLSKELHGHIDYLEKINNYLKLPPKLGFNQESVTQSNLIFTNYITDFNKQKLPIETSLRLALNHIENSPYDKCTFLSTAMKTLSHKYNRCQRLAVKQREKLKNYSMIVMEFDKDKQILLKNILELETLSIKRMTPSKITITCAEQIKSIKLNIQNANKCFDIFESLSIRSFDIKCFGGRIDNSQLNLELREYSLKVAKIQKRLRERIRIFNQAYREDKLFSDSYASLNSWLDESYNMVESFKNEPTKVLDHLDKLKNLCKQLSSQYANFHCTIRYGSYLKDKCIADDPEKAILIDMLKTLRNKWNKIRNLIITEKTTINRKMISTGNIYDAIKCLSYWINDSIAKFMPDLKLYGDIDTVEVLIDECLMTEKETNNHKEDFKNLKIRMLKEIQNYEENEIRHTMKNIEDQFSLFVINIQQRSKSLQESLQLAHDFNTKLNDLELWLRKAEKQLKIKSLPKFQNEPDLIELIEKHEAFVKHQKEMKTTLINFNNFGKTILNNCHPMAKNYVSRIIFKIGNRWNQINLRSDDRSKKLNESLGNLRGSTALIEELIYKVGEYLHKIQNENLMEIPNDIQLINDLINKHLVFNNELTEIDNQIKNLIKEFKKQNLALFQKAHVKRYRDRSEFIKNIWKSSKDSLNKSTDDLSSNNRLNFLNSQFNKLWKLSIERKVYLQNYLLELNEKEQLKRFDFNKWKIDFLTFIKVKGLRLTDIFRRQPSRKTGYHTLDEFVNCLLKSGFPTNKYILQQVFSIFEKKNTNEILYQDFIDSMRPERKSQIDKNINLNDKKAVTMIIHDIIELEVAECKCSIRYYVKKEGDNKYRFGQNGKMYMVRYLNAAVMVRIGGGWQTLTEFLKKNDPCRTTSSLDVPKLKSFKSPTSSAPKTGKLEEGRSSVIEKSTVKRPLQFQKASSLSSKIPSAAATRLSKK